jgi:hypothetical protein
MAAKRVDPLKAKQAKQKKMAIGLCVVLAAVLVFQVPRTLKMLKGPQPVATAAPATTTGTATTPTAAPAAAPVAGAPVAATGLPPAAGEAQPAVLVDSDTPAAADAGQLRSFERFQTKDPFVQQDAKVEAPPTAPKPETTPEVDVKTPAAGGGSVVTAPGSTTTPGSSTPGTTTPSTTPEAPVAALAATTSISVNGVAEDVATEASFPAASPVFVLVSLGKDGKSVQIGIAGGSYADGAATIKLVLGKPLTLRNTADGTTYVLVLKTVAGFAPPAAPAQK